MKHSLSYLVSVLCISSTLAFAEAPKPRVVVTPPEGRVLDDAFAIAADGESIAYTTFTTDGTAKANLHVRALGSSTAWTLEGLTLRPDTVSWIDPQHLLLVAESADKKQKGVVVTLNKGARAIPGEYDAIAAGIYDKIPAVVLHRRNRDKAGKTELRVRLIDAAALNELTDASYPIDAKGAITVGRVQVRPITFEAGNRIFVGVREGSFDKQRDMQTPDRVAKVDLAKGRIIEDRANTEELDPIRLANLTTDRKLHPNLPRFVTWNADRTGLQLIDDTKITLLHWERDVVLYDPETLQSGMLDGSETWIAIKIDSLNPIAIEKKRRDVDDLEIYVVDSKRGVPERRLVVDGLGRSANVSVVGSTVAVYRKQKVMERGGISIEIFPLSKPATAGIAAPPAQ